MDEKSKNLLLKDLCARLPYGVKMCYTSITDAMSNIDKGLALELPADMYD